MVSVQVPISQIVSTGLFDKLAKMKYDIPNDDLSLFDDYSAEIEAKLGAYLK